MGNDLDSKVTDEFLTDARVYELLAEIAPMYEMYLEIAVAANAMEALEDTVPSTSFIPYDLAI